MPKFNVLVQENEYKHGTVEIEADTPDTPEEAEQLASKLENDLDEGLDNPLKSKIKWEEGVSVDYMTELGE